MYYMHNGEITGLRVPFPSLCGPALGTPVECLTSEVSANYYVEG